MRILLMLFDVMLPVIILWLGISIVYGGYVLATKKKAWSKWRQKPTPNLKEVTISSLEHDMKELYASITKRIPKESEQRFIAILALLHSLKEKEEHFAQWKNIYSTDSNDFVDILYKHIPESLNRYFSIPEGFTKKQKDAQNKSADQLLNETFDIFFERVDEITQNLIEQKITDLKHYQTLIKTKYHHPHSDGYTEKEYE